MFKRLLLAIAMLAALAGCNTPAGSASPSAINASPSAPSLESPSDSGLESPSDAASPSESAEPSDSAEPSESASPS